MYIIFWNIICKSFLKKWKHYPIDQNGNQDPEYTLAILYSLVRNLFSAFCSSCSIVSVYLLQSESSRKDHSIPSPFGMQVQVITSCKFFDLPYKSKNFLVDKNVLKSWKAEITWVQGWMPNKPAEAKINCYKNVRAWVSMVSYLKNFRKTILFGTCLINSTANPVYFHPN